MAQSKAARFSACLQHWSHDAKGSGPVPEIDEAALVRLVRSADRGGVLGSGRLRNDGEASTMPTRRTRG